MQTPTPPGQPWLPLNPLVTRDEIPAAVVETYEELWIPASAVKLGGVNDPDFVQMVDDDGGSTGAFAYALDAAAEEEVFFEVKLPNYWKEGTAIEPRVHWSPSDGGAGDVIWQLEYSWANVGEPFGFTDMPTCEDAADEVAGQHQVAEFGEFDATDKTAASVLSCRLCRHAADVADTYAADAFFLGVGIRYKVDLTTVGSTN